MFYVMDKENKLSIFDDNKIKLEQTKAIMPQLEGQYTIKTDIVTAGELREHPNKVIVGDVEIEIDVPDYDEETGEETGTHKETIIVKGLVINPDYEHEQAEKEAQRIAQLHLTRGDVFRGLLMARQVTRAQIRALIEQMPDETPEQQIAKEYALIDFDESLDFYRGVALIDTLGAQLGISGEAMTQFFETNDWHYLIPDMREVQ